MVVCAELVPVATLLIMGSHLFVAISYTTLKVRVYREQLASILSMPGLALGDSLLFETDRSASSETDATESSLSVTLRDSSAKYKDLIYFGKTCQSLPNAVSQPWPLEHQWPPAHSGRECDPAGLAWRPSGTSLSCWSNALFPDQSWRSRRRVNLDVSDDAPIFTCAMEFGVRSSPGRRRLRAIPGTAPPKRQS
jgi:hypothetical protein